MKKKSHIDKTNQLGDSGEWEFFDDCAICQAMKSAHLNKKDLSMKELQKAFEEANKKQEISK